MKKIKYILVIFIFIFLTYFLLINILLNTQVNIPGLSFARKHHILEKIHSKKLLNPFDLSLLKYPNSGPENTILIDFSQNDKLANDSILTLAFKEKSFKDELKSWRKSNIYFNKINFKIKYKFHGSHLAPYLLGKRSLRVKSKKYIKGRKAFKLITGTEADFINVFMATLVKQQGLIGPEPGEIILATVNNKTEDYWLTSDLLDSYLKKEHGLSEFKIFETRDDWDRFSRSLGTSHLSELDEFFQYQDHENDLTNTFSVKANGKYRDLKKFANSNEPYNFKFDLLDEDYLGRFLAILYLYNVTHYIAGDNDKWLYNNDEDKFYPIARNEWYVESIQRGITDFDIGLFDAFYPKAASYKIYKKMLTNPQVILARNHSFYQLVLNEKNILHQLDSIYLKSKYLHHEYVRDKYLINRAAIIHNLDVISEYLTNCQIAIAYNTETRTLAVVTDSRVPIEFTVNKFNLTYSIDPIKYSQSSNGLNTKIEEQYFSIDEGDIRKEDLIFINRITKDTITQDRVIFNYY